MIILIGLIVSIAILIVCFISTENYISSIVVGVVFLLYFLLYAVKAIKNKDEKVTKFQECYHFVNNFLVSLSIKGNVSSAWVSTLETQSEEFKDITNSLDSPDSMGKINYLKNYFPFSLYSLFVDIINLYVEEGGDILQMSSYLLNQIRETEEYIVNAERVNKNTLIEFSILWILSLAILAILKFTLDDFFKYIVSSMLYQIGVVCILLFVLLSVHITVKKVTNLNVKGWYMNEK